MKRKDYIHVLMEYCKEESRRHSCFLPEKLRYEEMTAVEAFERTEKELRRLNTIIRNKKTSNDFIGNSIFSQDVEMSDEESKKLIFVHYTAAYYCFQSFRTKMESEDIFNEIGVLKYGYLINQLLYDIRYYATEVGQIIDNNYLFFSGGSANTEDSGWHFVGTRTLFYNCTS